MKVFSRNERNAFIVVAKAFYGLYRLRDLFALYKVLCVVIKMIFILVYMAIFIGWGL